MKLNQVKHILSWYEKRGDALMRECTLELVSLTELQNLFELQSDNPMFYCYPVKSLHVDYLQKYVQHKINLELYDYFIEA